MSSRREYLDAVSVTDCAEAVGDRHPGDQEPVQAFTDIFGLCSQGVP